MKEIAMGESVTIRIYVRNISEQRSMLDICKSSENPKFKTID